MSKINCSLKKKNRTAKYEKPPQIIFAYVNSHLMMVQRCNTKVAGTLKPTRLYTEFLICPSFPGSIVGIHFKFEILPQTMGTLFWSIDYLSNDYLIVWHVRIPSRLLPGQLYAKIQELWSHCLLNELSCVQRKGSCGPHQGRQCSRRMEQASFISQVRLTNTSGTSADTPRSRVLKAFVNRQQGLHFG